MSEDEDMSEWESEEDVIVEELESASRELSRAKRELSWDELQMKSALILLLSVRNTVLDVLAEDGSGDFKELQDECELQDIDAILRVAYLVREFHNTQFAFKMVYRYESILWVLLEHFWWPGEDYTLSDISRPKKPKTTKDDIGFVSYEYCKEQITEVSKTLEPLDRVFRFSIESMHQRKMYACDFIFSLEKLRTIFDNMLWRVKLWTADVKAFQIFNAAFLCWINDIGGVVVDILEFWKSDVADMMVARLMDMSRKMSSYCDSLDSSILQWPFIGIEDMGELKNLI